MRGSTKRTQMGILGVLVTAALVLSGGAALAGDAFRDVRAATARFHSVTQAEKAGYVEFLDCFDSEEGGQGQHYVDLGALDGTVDPLAPESLVYEIVDGKLKLVSVEYIVPSPFVDPANPPELFGEHFHEDPSLGVWVLHAWIWRSNPDGVFADYNPAVASCP